MKRFVCGFILGALLFGGLSTFAVSYIAESAEFKVLVNGNEFVSDPPALVVDGRTYLPLRAMGETLGVPVRWNEELRQVEVGSTPESEYYLLVNEKVIAGEWEITISSIEAVDEVWFESSLGRRFHKPDDGNKFVVFNVAIKNNYDVALSLLNSTLLRVTFDDQYIYGSYQLLGNPNDLISATIQPLATRTGFLAFQVPDEVINSENPLVFKNSTNELYSFIFLN